MLICMGVQIYHLRKPPPPGAPDRTRQHRQMTITILMLSALFFLCSTLSFTMLLLAAATLIPYSDAFYTLYSASNTTAPLLNASLSPLILIIRSTWLNAALQGTIRRVLRMDPAANPAPAGPAIPAPREEIVLNPTANPEPAGEQHSIVVANTVAVAAL